MFTRFTRTAACVLALGALALPLSLTGCASTSPARATLPAYEWVSARQAVSLMNQRANSFDNALTVGRMTLQEAAVGSDKPRIVEVDFALVLMGTRHLRLRAWKMNQPVLDVTLNPEGLWLWTAEGAPSLPLSGDDLRRLSRILQNRVAVEADVVKEDETFIVLREQFPRDGQRAEVTIHKQALVATGYQFNDDDGRAVTGDAARQLVALTDYDLVDYYPWPMRATFQGRAGTMRLTFAEVQTNTSLPPGAFTPYSRATRQP